eukprot:scaffold228828_cov34-Prasinocladus_malaysianus.AAC.2
MHSLISSTSVTYTNTHTDICREPETASAERHPRIDWGPGAIRGCRWYGSASCERGRGTERRRIRPGVLRSQFCKSHGVRIRSPGAPWPRSTDPPI